jgi:hypothetical protein
VEQRGGRGRPVRRRGSGGGQGVLFERVSVGKYQG